MFYSPTPQLLGLFVLIAIVSGLFLPCLVIYAIVRALRDLRRIANALEWLASDAERKANAELWATPAARTIEPGSIVNSMFGR